MFELARSEGVPPEASRIVYIAGRLFDVEEKWKSELLEAAVIEGLRRASRRGLLPHSTLTTFVPFRDAGQELLELEDKARVLYELDIARLDRTALLVAYIDGLGKDEGVCFEVGYAAAKGIPILLVSTDFLSHRLGDAEFALDPLLMAAAEVVRFPHLRLSEDRTFRQNLEATRGEVLESVSARIVEFCERFPGLLRPPCPQPPPARGRGVFLEFGGELFEWQRDFVARLESKLRAKPRYNVVRAGRYRDLQWLSATEAGAAELRRIADCGHAILCTDGEECPAGTAFAQGYARSLGRAVWQYNSKTTSIVGSGGYRSSRNLMLDYSADKVFRTFADLILAVEGL
ncbi:MAG: nucleoside 2-deoxyribosyltransferase [Fimbriimonas sp.]